MRIKTFEQIKSNYRICQINDRFYIQKKTKLGFWSNFTDTGGFYENPLIIILFVLIAMFTILFILGFVKMISVPNFDKVFLFLLFPYIIFISLLIIFPHFTKKFCDKSYNINQSKNSVDELVNFEIKKSKLKQQKLNQRKNKVKKYHYFYSESQLRKEKLKILK